jgi:hypothetical protein
MPGIGWARPPWVRRWLILLASRIVPVSARREWLSKWRSGLDNWWILVQRGELIADEESARYSRTAFTDAMRLRFGRPSWRRFLRGPGFVLAVIAAAVLATAAASQGFAATRALVGLAIEAIRTNPPKALPDAIITHAVPIVLALVIAGVLLVLRKPAIRSYGTRYWAFLAAKTAGVMLAVPLIWIESAELFRAVVPPSEYQVMITGVVFRGVFIVAFSCAVLWSFSDQRRRCPVCLQRLAMPVRIGTSASLFDPVRVESLCEHGHGLLSVIEAQDGEDEEWTALDESWQELFTAQ